MVKNSQLLKITGILLLLLGLALAVMACGETSDPEALSTDPAENWETFKVVTVEPTAIPIADVPPPTPTKAPSPTPPPAIMAPDDGCVECHTSEEMLKETASEEEAGHEELSEGEG